MKKLFLYLDATYIGEATVGSVRGHKTWMFRYADEYISAGRPILDPSVANVRGPQFPAGRGRFGFLADIAPDRWGRKLIRRREKCDLMESDYLLGGATAFGYATIISYAQYDVYVYMGTDKTDFDSNSFGPVTVTDGTKTTVCPAANTAWGSANSTHGTVTYEEGKNYFRVSGCTGATLKIVGSKSGSPSGTRCGLAGVQVVNRTADVPVVPTLFWLR